MAMALTLKKYFRMISSLDKKATIQPKKKYFRMISSLDKRRLFSLNKTNKQKQKRGLVMANVSLRNVGKSYGDVHISKDINLEINEGEFVVFVGPSGCGKSTLLRMIAGLEDITTGELYIGGKLMNEVEPSKRGIGMVFQSYALYPHLDVAENMSFGLKLAGVSKAERDQRVNQVAEILQLAHLLDRKPKALSGGQRQRVAIGRTLVSQPEVFLLDEPLSNLDAALRVQMRVEISNYIKN